MKDLDDVMSRYARRVHSEYERTQRDKLPHLQRELVRRVRRRRLRRRVARTFLAVASIAAVIVLSPSLEPEDARIGRGAAVASGGSVAEDPFSQWGFWPYASRDLSEHVCGSAILRGSENAAAGFASSVLRWTNPVVIGENRYGDHITTTIGELPPPLLGGPLPPPPVIELGLERLHSENCWWVTAVGDPDDGATFDARVEDGDLRVSFDLLPGAERADVVVVEANHNVRHYLNGDAGATTARLHGFRGPGFVIVLWKGADGVVLSASGVTLPDGDSTSQPF